MTVIPDTNAGPWSQLFIKGATWPSTTITMSRDGVVVIPVFAALYVYSPEGTLLLTVTASIDGGGEMTVGPVPAATTGAFTWDYGNSVFTVTESGSVVTDLLAGNATVRNYGD